MQLDDLTDSQTEAFLNVISHAITVSKTAKLIGVDPTGELFAEGTARAIDALDEAIVKLKQETIVANSARPKEEQRQGATAKSHPVSQYDRGFWQLFSGVS